MHMHARIGIALAITALTATAATAQAVKKYGSEAGWDIFIKDNMGPGCLIAKKTSDVSQVEMGIDATGEKKGYIALYTKKDAAVSAGEQVSVLFDVDGQQFSGRQSVSRLREWTEHLSGSTIRTSSTILPRRTTLTISPAGRDPIVLSLKGTDAAFKTLRACQDAQ